LPRLPFVLGGLALLAPAPVAAQDSLPRLAGVEIVREDVADSSEAGLLAEAGNALHWRTREWVVRRELLLDSGSRYDPALAAETARNLRSLGIFRRVLIDTVRTDGGLVLRVLTKDGWSTQPIFDINAAAGQTAFSLGVQEQNLIGLAAYAAVRYRSTPDRTSWYFLYRQPRLIARRINVSAAWDERSDGRSVFGSAGQPFFALSSRWSFGVDLTTFDGDVLVFRGGSGTAFATLRRRLTLARAHAAHAVQASSRGYVRVGLSAQLQWNAMLPAPPSVTFDDTTQVAMGPYVSWASARYAVVRNVRSFLREEDEFVGWTLRFGVLAAPRAFGFSDDGVGLHASAGSGLQLPGGFVRGSAAASGLLRRGAIDSGTVVLQGDLVVQPAARHSIIAAGFAGWQHHPVPGSQFDLGLTYGLRAFPLHAFAGDRAYLVSAEYRWTFAEDLRGLIGLGLGAFVDHGGAWYDGDAPRRGTDFGVGVRFGPSRLSNSAPFRLDLAYRLASAPFPGGWAVVFGRGFTF
jgi:hypothetical protein